MDEDFHFFNDQRLPMLLEIIKFFMKEDWLAWANKNNLQIESNFFLNSF